MTVVAMGIPGNRQFFLLSQVTVQTIKETVKPPIHKPVIESSILSQRDKPTAPQTATVQTGQMAWATGEETKITVDDIRRENKMILRLYFICFVVLNNGNPAPNVVCG